MYLENITLEDFQPHAEVTIDFARTITTVVGATDVGKSSILRALRWVCLNDIAGAEFVREGSKQTKVTLQIGNGKSSKEIIRTKSADGRVNTYAIDDKEYKAFGMGAVPPDVARILNLSAINFQGQHDSPFWFAESAGEVSRQLNAVIDLSVIDTTLFNIGSAVRREQERKAVCEERLATAKTQLEEVLPQKERIAAFAKLKEHNAALQTINGKVFHLEGIVAGLGISSAQLNKFTKQTADQEANLILAWRAVSASRGFQKLSDLIQKIQAPRPAAPPNFEFVRGAFGNWSTADGKHNALARLVCLVNNAHSVLTERTCESVSAETEFLRRTKGARCPLCQSPLLS